MKKRFLVASAAALFASTLLAGCGHSRETITLWVGQESTAFYDKVCKEYVSAHPDFKYDVKVVGADTGAAAGQLIADNTACGDIVTIAHDNIGKLSQTNKILPITDEALLAQINADNPEGFKKVIKNKYGAGKDAPEFTFAVPYISQALFLYYNKDFVTPEQALTFEGLTEAAKTAGKKAYTVTGLDSFNFSFTTLAVRNEDKFSSVKIYDEFKMANCFFQGNDTIAVARWAQDSFADKNGGLMPRSSGWAVDLKNNDVLSIIGGAWHYNAVKSAIGADKVGCALIPTFTLKESHVAGLTANEFDSNVPTAGQVYRGGTFADCKCFVINNASKEEKTDSMVELITYLSSKAVQNRSYMEALNVPAHKDAAAFIESQKDKLDRSAYEMAKSQLEMAQYGQPQPFMTGILNTYFYSKGADSAYKQIVINEGNKYGEVRAIREALYSIEHTWTKGKSATSFPAELPAAMPKKGQ